MLVESILSLLLNASRCLGWATGPPRFTHSSTGLIPCNELRPQISRSTRSAGFTFSVLVANPICSAMANTSMRVMLGIQGRSFPGAQSTSSLNQTSALSAQADLCRRFQATRQQQLEHYRPAVGRVTWFMEHLASYPPTADDSLPEVVMQAVERYTLAYQP